MSKEIKRSLSPEDKLYKDLTGEVFDKAGTAYERLSTAVAKIILKSKEGRHNVFKSGTSSVTHQLDGLLDDTIALEAKDYSGRQAKVGLKEVQNQQGAMLDIEGIEKGFFASATDYTSEAERYVAGTLSNPRFVDTHAAIIRHSVPDDEKGRIKTFVLNIEMPYLAFERGKYILCMHDQAEADRFNRNIAEKKSGESLRISQFYDAKGNPVKTMEELSIEQIPDDWDKKEEIKGRFVIDGYIYVDTELYHLGGIDYEIPVKVMKETATIEANGNACCLVKCPSLGIDRLITDTDLRQALATLK